MNSSLTLLRAETPKDVQAVKDIFQAFLDYMPIDFGFQGIEKEMAEFPKTYEFLLLAKHMGKPVGAVALKKHSDETCEMKRLYVLPEAQGTGAGKALCDLLLSEAKAAGFQTMLLDSLRRLEPAVALYKKLGFKEIEPYNFNPEADVVYMKRSLLAAEAQYTILPATEAMTPKIVTLLRESFLAAYPDLYDADDIQQYFAKSYTPEKVEQWLEDTSVRILIAQNRDQFEGILVYKHQASPLNPGLEAIEIEKLYLMPTAYGTGLAQALMESIAEREKTESPLYWLQVARNNTKAQKYYRKHGFTIVGDGSQITVGQEKISSLIMHKEI